MLTASTVVAVADFCSRRRSRNEGRGGAGAGTEGGLDPRKGCHLDSDGGETEHNTVGLGEG